jgi:hypothetical protein
VSGWPNVSVPLQVLDAAVFAHQALPLHAHEQRPSTVDLLYQDFARLLERLDTAEWQIIYGASGAGKTTVLRAFVERTRRGALNHREPDRLLSTLALYLDAQQFRPPLLKVDPEVHALAAFRLFLTRLSESLVQATSAMVAADSLYVRVTRRRSRSRTRAEAVVREILAVVDQASPEWPFSPDLVTIEETESRSVETARAAEAGVRIDPSGSSGVHIAGHGAHESASKRSQTTSRSRSGLGHPDWARIAGLLVEFCAELQIERVDILIDNFTKLDTDGRGTVQPFFADLLRRSFHSTAESAVSVKLAADGLQARLWAAAESRGLDPDAHVTMVENLNYALLDDNALCHFFEHLLFRRMLKDTDQLRRFLDPDTPGAPLSGRFLESLFDTRGAFELLVRGTEGRPRLFLHCIRDLAHRTNFSVRDRWTREQVLDVVERRCRPALEDMEHYSAAVQTLMRDVKPAVTGNNTRRFRVRRSEVQARDGDLEELIGKRLIRRVESPGSEDPRREAFVDFEISDDLTREWERARRFQTELRASGARGDSPPGMVPSADPVVVTLSTPIGG